MECNQLQEELYTLFLNEGYLVKKINETDNFIETAKEYLPNLIFLGYSNFQQGINFCKEIKSDKELLSALVIMVSNYNEEAWEELAFNSGVNDYLIKPIKTRALLLRIETHLKKHNNSVIIAGNLTLNTNSFNVYLKDKRIYLTKKEFEVLEFLIKRPFRIFSRSELFEQIWGNELQSNERTVDVHINRIRDKIGKEYIQTVIRVGYKFVLTQHEKATND